MREAGVAAAAAALGIAGCSNPFEMQSTQELRREVEQSFEREAADSRSSPEVRPLARTPGEVSFPPERMAELEGMAGAESYRREVPPVSTDLTEDLDPEKLRGIIEREPLATKLGPDLLGNETRVFQVSLEQTLAAALRNNLDVQQAQLRPAIGGAAVAAAEAAFDWAFFAGYEWERLDQARQVPVVNGVPVGVGASMSDSNSYETGVRKRLTSGGTFSVSQGMTNYDDRSPDISIFPDPSNAPFLQLRLDQPLLRGAGSEVALAEVRLTRNAERDEILVLKSTLIATLTETERAYWELVQALQRLRVVQRLLLRGIVTRDVLAARLDFDVQPSEYSEAVATVESRRAQVIREVNNLRRASDRLKLLINDPELTVGSEILLLPVDEAIDEGLSLSLLDSIQTAISNRPEVQRAILGIDDASIRQTVARNARLPLLDLAMQTRFAGLDESASEGYEDITEAQFVDFLVGVQFEQPIGNRQAEALYRQRQLERLSATVAYRQTLQNVVLSVKNAMRELGVNYQLIEQTRASRLASAENLRTLLVQERTTRALSPDFLDLKFRRQEALASAELQEIAALIDYNIAIADYHAALGTTLERNRVAFVVPDAGQLLRSSAAP